MKPPPFPLSLPTNNVANGRSGGGVNGVDGTSRRSAFSLAKPKSRSSNNRPAETTHDDPSPQQYAQCTCCPYGFHIDLGFVKFAEDVSTGRGHADGWTDAALAKRSRLGFSSPRSLSSPANGVSSPASCLPNTMLHSYNNNDDNSLLLDSSMVSSRSVDENGGGYGYGGGDVTGTETDVNVSELDDVLQETKPVPINGDGRMFKPVSILKKRNRAEKENQQAENGHRSRRIDDLHPPSTMSHPANAYPPRPVVADVVSKRYQGALSVPEDSFVNRQQLHSVTAPLPIRTSTPSKANVVELHHVLSPIAERSTPSMRLPTGNGFRQAPQADRALFPSGRSAPNSPFPTKLFHTAIAQSMARLKNAPPNNTGSQHLPPPSNHIHAWSIPSSTFRVFSPESTSEAIRHPRHHDTIGDEGYDAAESLAHNNGFPYRNRGGATPSILAPSPLAIFRLNIDQFASVRRQRAGFGGDEEQRQAPPQRSASAPKWRQQTEGFEGRIQLAASRIEPKHYEKRGRSVSVTALHAPHSPPPPPAPTEPAAVVAEVEEPKHVRSIMASRRFSQRGTQTHRMHKTPSPLPPKPPSVAVGVGTDQALLHTLIPPRPKTESIAVDTVDLQRAERRKKTPPEPPPKPSRANDRDLLGVEFQYCIGHEPEYRQGEEPGSNDKGPVMDRLRKKTREAGSLAKPQLTDRATSPLELKMVDIGVTTQHPKISNSTSQTAPVSHLNAETQTDHAAELLAIREEVQRMFEEEKALQRIEHELAEAERKDDNNEPLEEFIMITCSRCGEQANTPSSALDYLVYEKIEDDEPENVKQAEVSELGGEVPTIEDAADKTSIRTVTSVTSDASSGAPTVVTVVDSAASHRQLDPSKTEAIRKLLMERRQQPAYFQRDSNTYRSHRVSSTKAKEADDLEYIAEKYASENTTEQAEPSTPYGEKSAALKEMVVLKKGAVVGTPTSPSSSSSSSSSSSLKFHNFNGPIPAKIPRPKFSRYMPESAQAPETPDEEAEAVDRLTPLRSEMRPICGGWSGSSGSPVLSRFGRGTYIGRLPPGSGNPPLPAPLIINDDDEDDEEASSTSSSSSTASSNEGTYEMSEREAPSSLKLVSIAGEFEGGGTGGDGKEFELSTPLREALETVNQHLSSSSSSSAGAGDGGNTGSTSPPAVTHTQEAGGSKGGENVDWAYKYINHEWLKMATRKDANADLVEAFLDVLESYSHKLMAMIVNSTDQNGNTALHYAVSHENYSVVSVLLDSKVAQVDEMNKAGYSAVMLGALCDLKNAETESAVIQRLLQVGNINAKALKHSQTALMLAASHGRVETTNLLLACGADVNIQDVDGSTALMCAAEHGQKEIVRILLNRPNIDASLTDCDNQTALSIAVENQHRDIAVLIYAHLNYSRLEQNDHSVSV